MKPKLKCIFILSIAAILISAPFAVADAIQPDDCTFNGIPFYGTVQFVESFPDLTVEVVDAFPDLRVQLVDSFPDQCGQWQEVDSFPDFSVQVVTAFPDITIQYVDAFPGLPGGDDDQTGGEGISSTTCGC